MTSLLSLLLVFLVHCKHIDVLVWIEQVQRFASQVSAQVKAVLYLAMFVCYS